jgi:hypothetical protein
MENWLRKKAVKKRNGDCSDRKLDRLVAAGLYPAPEHPWGNRIPAWRESVLNAHDAAVAAATAAAKSAGPPPVDPTKAAAALKASLARSEKLRARNESAAKAEGKTNPPEIKPAKRSSGNRRALAESRDQ